VKLRPEISRTAPNLYFRTFFQAVAGDAINMAMTEQYIGEDLLQDSRPPAIILRSLPPVIRTTEALPYLPEA
jgi:hypothetical protein